VLICPIRYDDGPHAEDQRLWRELRLLFRDSPTQLLGFVSVSKSSHWMDQYNPLR
jgi:hypothetical protein